MATFVRPQVDPAGPVALQRLPQTDEELWWAVKFVFGIEVPRVQICQEHVAPFTAFADAYFALSPVAIWKASRGFGGKSYMLGLLALTEAVFLGAESSVLGGSASQSQNVKAHTDSFWMAPNAPRHLLLDAPTKYETLLSNRGHIRALMASQRSVRGPHPQRLRLDEIDEMDLDILEAAQGQPMPSRGIESQTVMSSTHQYPDKTMSAMLERARHMGWPAFHWCYRESMGTKTQPGWLRPGTIMRKKSEVNPRFWNVEYELQAPSFEGRAIDSEWVDKMFDVDNYVNDDESTEYIVEPPIPDCRSYVTGVDWAKERDWTIIWTHRFDPDGTMQTVAWQRVQRRPWPEMVLMVEERAIRYPGILIHDANGIGNVVSDLLNLPRGKVRVEDEILAGRHREAVFNEYIAGIEEGMVKCPRYDFPYHEHLYCRREDLFKTGGHPPDSFVAGALAWSMRNDIRPTSFGRIIVNERTTSTSPWTIPSL